jgi:uncharacterized protein (TIGR03083 family)
MTRDEYLSALRQDGSAMAATSSSALGTRVPACPDWDVSELIGHTGSVHRWVDYVLRLPEGEKPRRDGAATAPGGQANLAWFGEGLDSLISALETTSSDKPVFTLTGVQPASWWLRRITHETAIHRWDLQDALGTADGFGADLARDGIDELLDVMAPRRFDYGTFGASGQTIHLHATDGEGEWFLTVGPDSLAWEHGHQKGDVAARGPLRDLYLLVWSRIEPDKLDVVGDASLLKRFQDASNI